MRHAPLGWRGRAAGRHAMIEGRLADKAAWWTILSNSCDQRADVQYQWCTEEECKPVMARDIAYILTYLCTYNKWQGLILDGNNIIIIQRCLNVLLAPPLHRPAPWPAHTLSSTVAHTMPSSWQAWRQTTHRAVLAEGAADKAPDEIPLMTRFVIRY